MRYRNRARSSSHNRIRSHRRPQVEALETRLLLAADALEPNNTFAQPKDLGTTDQAYQGLTIDPVGDQDYYRWTATQDGLLKVDIAFSAVIGDLDLELYNSSGSPGQFRYNWRRRAHSVPSTGRPVLYHPRV